MSAPNGATLDLDFVHDQYWLNGTSYSGVAKFITGAGATFTRSSVGTYFNASGVMQTASANLAAPRLSLAQLAAAHILKAFEESRTNSIRTDKMVGAVASSATQLGNNGAFAACSGATCSGRTTTVNGGTGSVSFASGTAILTGDGTKAASIYQAITTVPANYYTITVTNASGNAVTVQAGTTAGSANLLAATTVNAGATTSYQIRGSGTTLYVQVNNTSTTAANVTLISMQSPGAVPTNWGLSVNDTTDLYGQSLALAPVTA